MQCNALKPSHHQKRCRLNPLHSSSLRAPKRPRGRGPGAAAGSEPSLLVLPVFPLPSAVLPTESGVLRAHEPRYVALFQALQEAHPEGGGRFVHILSGAAAPPALLEPPGGVLGLPHVGCCASVTEVRQEEGPGGPLIVSYSVQRRVSLLGRAPQDAEPPYLLAAAEWYDDDAPKESAELDALELELARSLRSLERLLAGPALPAAVWRHAPPPPARRTSYDALKASGARAAAAIDTWRRHGSVYGESPHAPAPSTSDPYQVVREEVGKGQRQELFSFAASQMLDLGLPQRSALLGSQDTAGRLQYVLTALRPYLRELEARASLRGVLGREAA